MESREKSGKRKWFKRLKWLVAIVVLLFLFLAVMQFDPQSLIDSARQIPLWSVILLFALQIVTQLMLNLQWHQIAKSFASPLKFSEMLYVNTQAEIIHIAPAGHIGCDVFRAVQINRAGNISGEQSASVVAIQKLFSLSALFIISLISIGFFIGQVPWLQENAPSIFAFLLYGLLLVILTLMGCVFIMPHKMSVFLNNRWRKGLRFSWMNRLRVFIIASLEHVVYLRKNPKLLAILTVIALCIWMLYPLKLYILAFQLMTDINILYISAATFLSYAVAMIPIFPGGLGGFEATLTGLLLFMGFAQSGALVITVLFRFATFWFVILLSLMYMALYKVLSSRFLKKATQKL